MIKLFYSKSLKIIFSILFLLTITSFSDAGDKKNWMVEVNGGIAAIHDTVFDDIFLSIQGSRSIASNNSVMLDFGIFIDLENFYVAVAGGIKYRFCPDKKISPFIHLGAGQSSEEHLSGVMITVSAGIDINVTKRTVIPIVFQYGRHNYSEGPHAVFIGIGYRF